MVPQWMNSACNMLGKHQHLGTHPPKSTWAVTKILGIIFPMEIERSHYKDHYPIGSMGRTVYLPTWMVDFYGKCRWIYHTWILWVWINQYDGMSAKGMVSLFVPMASLLFPYWFLNVFTFFFRTGDTTWWFCEGSGARWNPGKVSFGVEWV